MKSEKYAELIADHIKIFYNSFASSFSSTRHSPTNEFDLIKKFLPAKEISILDYGCGNGRLYQWLLENITAFKYTGYDQSENLIEIAKEKYPEAEFSSELPNKRFDVVVCFAVFHHFPTDSLIRKEARKIAKYVADDGILLITGWDFDSEYAKKALHHENPQKLAEVASQYKLEPEELLSEMDHNDFFIPWKNEYYRYIRKFPSGLGGYIDDVTILEKGKISRSKSHSNKYIICRKQISKNIMEEFSKQLDPYKKDLLQLILDHKDKEYPALHKKISIFCNGKTNLPIKKSYLLCFVRNNRSFYGEGFKEIAEIFITKPTRTISGVSPIHIFTKPMGCPNSCSFCPNDPSLPKSYIKNEPSVFRGVRNNWDPEKQIENRTRFLESLGHPVQKVELIVAGGTWSSHPLDYQENFILNCYNALNKKRAATIEEAQKTNEETKLRMVGLTLETRPDYISLDELWKMRRYGATRVEIGVQSNNDQILKNVSRGHQVAETIEATELLKDLGFKVCYHMMPNLPGATIESDIEMFKQLFENPDFQPDLLKIYPCMVIENTELHEQFKAGKYSSYSMQELIQVMKGIKQHIPRYTRISRLIRDIPSSEIISGDTHSNLRQMVKSEINKEGWDCECIRCREIRDGKSKELHLEQIEYSASHGKEIFLSFKNENDKLCGLLRLRYPHKEYIPSISNYALIREVHTYGKETKLKKIENSQHKGIGKQLLAIAEKRAKKDGFDFIAVISGIGVRGYYKGLGYELKDTYMVKKLKKFQ